MKDNPPGPRTVEQNEKNLELWLLSILVVFFSVLIIHSRASEKKAAATAEEENYDIYHSHGNQVTGTRKGSGDGKFGSPELGL